MQYTVRVATSEVSKYHIEAESAEEAKELVLSGDYDPYESIDSAVDDVEVE